jgi:hypothetical protein
MRKAEDFRSLDVHDLVEAIYEKGDQSVAGIGDFGT